MIQDKPEPFRFLPCISDGCKSRKKKHSINAFQKGPSPKFSKILRSSLFFSDILSTYNRILGIEVQKKRPIPEQKSSIGRF